jgi:hypothetical protein
MPFILDSHVPQPQKIPQNESNNILTDHEVYFSNNFNETALSKISHIPLSRRIPCLHRCIENITSLSQKLSLKHDDEAYLISNDARRRHYDLVGGKNEVHAE